MIVRALDALRTCVHDLVEDGGTPVTPADVRAMSDVTCDAIAEAVSEHARRHEAGLPSIAEAVFNQSPMAICILEGPRHTFTFANPAYRQLVGKSEPVGKDLLQVFPELQGQGWELLLDRVESTGQSARSDGIPHPAAAARHPRAARGRLLQPRLLPQAERGRRRRRRADLGDRRHGVGHGPATPSRIWRPRFDRARSASAASWRPRAWAPGRLTSAARSSTATRATALSWVCPRKDRSASTDASRPCTRTIARTRGARSPWRSAERTTASTPSSIGRRARRCDGSRPADRPASVPTARPWAWPVP